MTRPAKPRRRIRTTEEIDRDAYRRISAWAKLWEDCTLAGCRRNARCLHEGACRMHTDKPWTEEQIRSVRAWLKLEVRTCNGNRR
jgi:hypothetical protein